MDNEQAKKSPVVWLVNEGGHDYKDAERFGRIMSMTTRQVNPFNPDRLMVRLSERLRMATEDDWVVVGGSPMLNGLVMSMWLIRFGKMNCLQWSWKGNNYEPVTISAEAVRKNALSEGVPA